MTFDVSLGLQLPIGKPVDPRWSRHAACRGLDPDLFFPERGGPNIDAVRTCLGCPVQAECLRHAMEAPEKIGVWGGTSERQRRVWRNRIKQGHDTVDTVIAAVTGADLEEAS